MGRWFAKLEKIRESALDGTDKTDTPTPCEGSVGFGGAPSEDSADFPTHAPEVSSVSAVPPQGVSEISRPDPDAFLTFLRDHGPSTYGAAAMALGWSPTRTWQAEAALQAAGRIRHDSIGRAVIMEDAQ